MKFDQTRATANQAYAPSRTRTLVPATIAAALFLTGIAAHSLLTISGPNTPLFMAVMAFDDFSISIAGITLVAYMSSLTSLGYTATQSGIVTAMTATMGLLVARFPPKLVGKYDPRLLLSCGLAWVGFCTLTRINWTSSSDMFTLMLPQMMMALTSHVRCATFAARAD